MDNKSKQLETALEAIKKAADEALKYYTKSTLGISFKDDNSMVTEADSKSEEVIKDYINSVFPNSNFIAEESENEATKADEVWIVDPIDGTSDFAHGVPFWSILLAYAAKGKVKLGVCYFPVLDILLFAESGKGAYCNNERIEVSRESDISKSIIGFSSLSGFKDAELDVLHKAVRSTSSTRGYNCSYSCYLTATGKHDGYLASSKNKIWDIAPFLSIIPEAGGKVTNWEGEETDIFTDKVRSVASNGLLHDGFVSIARI